MAEIGSRAKGYAYLFDTQAKLCQVLATKAAISVGIRQAYQEGNRQVLAEQVDGLQQLRIDLESFYQALSYQWMVEKKVFGLDTVDIRLGGLDARIRRAIQRLQAYLNNEVPKLDELEVPILLTMTSIRTRDLLRQLPTNGRLLRRLQPSIQPSDVRARKGSIFMQMLIGNPDFLCFYRRYIGCYIHL